MGTEIKQSGCSMEKLKVLIVRQEDASETEEKCVQYFGQTSSVVNPYGVETWATTKGQLKKHD